MAKYLFLGSYTVEGLRSLLRDGGTKQCEAVTQLVHALGGTVETFYYAYGSDDFYIIVDMPDSVATAAASLVVNATGVAQCQTVLLMAPTDMDAAVQKSSACRLPAQ